MTSFLITCSNATCAIPEANRELFKGSEDLVTSSEGWEPGALNLAQGLSMKLSTPLIHGDVTRLLIDLNESGDSRWSEISSKLPEATRAKLVERHEKKFRQAIENRIEEDLKRNEHVIHLVIHTAPIADGKIALEYAGTSLAAEISDSIIATLPATEVDSSSNPAIEKNPFMETMLEQYPAEKYGIIRITVSQSFFLKSIPMRWETIKKSLIAAISSATR